VASKSVASRHAQFREELQSAQPLPQAAREFVEAAKTLVEREGMSALTLQRVADEMGANKASIWYYFGGKEGLIEAVIHDNVLENCAWAVKGIDEQADDEARIDNLIEQTRNVLIDPHGYGGGFDLFAYSMHVDQFREQWARMYGIWYQTIRERLGLSEDLELSRHSSQLLAAVVDGLAMQRLMGQIDVESGELDRLLESLRFIVSMILKQLRESPAAIRDSEQSI
jgi:AcrR family transcriptional regulator